MREPIHGKLTPRGVREQLDAWMSALEGIKNAVIDSGEKAHAAGLLEHELHPRIEQLKSFETFVAWLNGDVRLGISKQIEFFLLQGKYKDKVRKLMSPFKITEMHGEFRDPPSF